MENEKRTLKQIRDDIKIVTSNKLNASQSKLLFMGIIYEIILRKDLFPKNSDLKAFINKIFRKYFINKEPFKEYLYCSRTILGARIQKEIQYEIEYSQIIKIVNQIYDILPVEESKKVASTKNRNNNIELGQWMNFIREKDKNK